MSFFASHFKVVTMYKDSKIQILAKYFSWERLHELQKYGRVGSIISDILSKMASAFAKLRMGKNF